MPKQDTRSMILDVASSLFYNNGYNMVGINEIIEKSNIAKATLYNHFKSKEDLCVAYLNLKSAKLMESLSSFTKSKKKGKSRIISIIEFLKQFYNSKEFKGCWCIRTNAELSNNERVNKTIRENKDQLMSFITEEVKLNLPDLTSKNSIELSKTVYLLYEAAVMESFLQNSEWPINHAIQLLKKNM